MAMTMHLDIVSAESEIFSGRAEVVVAPAIMGRRIHLCLWWHDGSST